MATFRNRAEIAGISSDRSRYDIPTPSWAAGSIGAGGRRPWRACADRERARARRVPVTADSPCVADGAPAAHSVIGVIRAAMLGSGDQLHRRGVPTASPGRADAAVAARRSLGRRRESVRTRTSESAAACGEYIGPQAGGGGDSRIRVPHAMAVPVDLRAYFTLSPRSGLISGHDRPTILPASFAAFARPDDFMPCCAASAS